MLPVHTKHTVTGRARASARARSGAGVVRIAGISVAEFARQGVVVLDPGCHVDDTVVFLIVADDDGGDACVDDHALAPPLTKFAIIIPQSGAFVKGFYKLFGKKVQFLDAFTTQKRGLCARSVAR